MTERAIKILLAGVEEYIKTGQPISSLHLSQKYDFGISPAMLRWELFKLEQRGFLIHPYTSCGRLPSEKGYRFFVNYILNNQRILNQKKKQISDLEKILLEFDAIGEVLEKISEISDSYLLWFDSNYDNVYESSLADVLESYEFTDNREILNFIKFIERIKSARDKILADLANEDIAVFIGNEFPYKEDDILFNFSLLGIENEWPKFGRAVLLMAGPQRMNYKNNLIILKKLKTLTL